MSNEFDFSVYENYILNEATMQKSLKYNKHSNPDKYKEPQLDSLFWTYYIMVHGETNYELIHTKNELFEKQTKITYIDLIRKNKTIIKSLKIDSIANIENNLTNENKLNVKTVLSLCAVQNINVVFVNNKTYHELIMCSDSPTYILRQYVTQYKGTPKYKFELSTTETLNHIYSTLYKVDSFDKPVKSMTSYTLKELQDIAGKLSIPIKKTDTGKNKLKTELYEEILMHF
jgi:hypothetical protein